MFFQVWFGKKTMKTTRNTSELMDLVRKSIKSFQNIENLKKKYKQNHYLSREDMQKGKSKCGCKFQNAMQITICLCVDVSCQRFLHCMLICICLGIAPPVLPAASTHVLFPAWCSGAAQLVVPWRILSAQSEQQTRCRSCPSSVLRRTLMAGTLLLPFSEMRQGFCWFQLSRSLPQPSCPARTATILPVNPCLWDLLVSLLSCLVSIAPVYRT